MSEVQGAIVTYELPDGQQVSRAAYIRYLFKEKNMSRGDIAKKLEVPYSTVYAATANMENKHHKSGELGIGAAKKFVELEDGTRMSRAEYIRKRIKEGASRSKVAQELDITYSAVWAATKDMEELKGSGGGGAVMITHPTTGKLVRRVDYIREAFAAGKTRREIANEIGCDYAVVWAATRSMKNANQPAADKAESNGAGAESGGFQTEEANASEPFNDDDDDDDNFPE